MKKQTSLKTFRSKEKNVHQQFAQYLKLVYPDVIFRTDFAAGARMTIGQAVQHERLQSDKSYPDVFIAESAFNYHGLFIELKRDFDELITKDGQLKKKKVAIYEKVGGLRVKVGEYDHLEEQQKMLTRLRDKGYLAVFVCGFEMAEKLVKWYLGEDVFLPMSDKELSVLELSLSKERKAA